MTLKARDCLDKFFSGKTTTVTSILKEEDGTILPVFTFCPGFKESAVADFGSAPPPPPGVLGPYIKHSYFALHGFDAGRQLLLISLTTTKISIHLRDLTAPSEEDMKTWWKNSTYDAAEVFKKFIVFSNGGVTAHKKIVQVEDYPSCFL